MRIGRDVIKLILFTAVALVVLSTLWSTLLNATKGATRTYVAEFADVTGLHVGDSVRMAGVRVGRVDDLELVAGNHADVTMSVRADQPLFINTRAVLRYQNLIGQRFVSLLPGAGPAPPLRDGGRIPLDHTEPSFDLTTLLNGFRPLFAVLQPADLNKLSANLIEVMQSTKPRVEPLLAQVAQVTNNFADRDKILGDVIVNLNSVLSQVGGKGPEIDALLDQSSRLIGGLKARSGTLVDSLDQTQRLAGKANDLITDLRPTLEHGIPHVREGIAVFHDNRKLLSQTVYAFPYFLGTLGKATQFGSWLTLYACDASLVTGPVTIPIALPGHAPTHTEVCR
ncbi:MAG TPA: MlaD family protein [Pseudonocardia sp.]|jgi:phospholipid/cholesterol/gamma-HCH transport system substrate-binding protein